MPKNEKQLLILLRYLENFNGKILMEEEFCSFKELSHFKVNTTPFKNKVLAMAFLEYCRRTAPKEAVILNARLLAPGFFSALAPLVGKICLPYGQTRDEICRLLLSEYGTPIVFSRGNGPTLCLGPSNCAYGSPLFCHSTFENPGEKIKQLLPNKYKGINPLELYTALYSENNIKNNLLDLWKNLVIEENMIYNNCD